MTYVFRYRRRGLWHSVVVKGHRYEQTLDKMVIYFTDGGLREIAKWSECDLRLGPDWALVLQKQMEMQAGQAIPVTK